MQELARLREYYHPMSDEELLELEGDIKNLNPTAQQVLNEELTLRGIGKKASDAAKVWRGANVEGSGAELSADSADDGLVDFPGPSAAAVYDDGKQFVDGKGQVFTYKTLLCECDDKEQAWQLKELLRRNGIDSWVQTPARSKYDLPLPSRVEVGADQLEQAKRIAAQPMPQEIIKMFEEIEEDVAEFEIDKCPQCGAEDPILEGVDPVNQWLCESCGHQWKDSEI